MFSKELYKSAKEIWDSYYTHAFVRGIGEGSLEKDKFKSYIIQDYIYLLDYAKLFALGVIKSKNESDMKKLGITELDIASEKPTLDNTSYTSYMLSVAHCGDIKEVAVAALSCMWSYEMIGLKLKELYGFNDEFYGEWIECYSSSRYKELTNWNIELVEKYCQNISEEEKEHLKTIFINCSIYEYKFWDMSYKGSF